MTSTNLGVLKSNRMKYLTSNDECVTRFNVNFHNLIKVCLVKNNKNETLKMIEIGYRTFIKILPNNVILYIGPCLWQYRQKILTKNETFLNDNSFLNDINNFFEKEKNNYFSKKDIVNIFHIIKKIWFLFSSSEKLVIWSYLTNMIKCYAHKIKLEKEINTINTRIEKEINKL